MAGSTRGDRSVVCRGGHRACTPTKLTHPNSAGSWRRVVRACAASHLTLDRSKPDSEGNIMSSRGDRAKLGRALIRPDSHGDIMKDSQHFALRSSRSSPTMNDFGRSDNPRVWCSWLRLPLQAYRPSAPWGELVLKFLCFLGTHRSP